MFEGILFLIIYIAWSLIVSYLFPVIITKNIFKFQLTKKEYFSYFIYLLLFPISILFSKSYYKNLEKQNIVNTKMKFVKIIWVMILLSFIFSIFITQWLIRNYWVKPFQSNGQSMYSTIYDKQFLLTTKIGLNNNRWDIIIYKPWVSEFKIYFLWRIIGLPGESIKIENWIVSKEIDWVFKPLDENYLDSESNDYTFVKGNWEAIIYNVPEDSYFILWDNRNHSTDSRTCFSSCLKPDSSNFISKADIEWKYFFDLWYFDLKTSEFKHPVLWIDTRAKFFDIK
jgi:signal peptidase I